jgi:hypothetical protein
MRFDLKDETFTSLRPPPLKDCEATDRPCDTPDLSYYVPEVDGKVCMVTDLFSCSAPRWRRYNTEVTGRMDVWMLESWAQDRWFRSRASSVGRTSCCTIATVLTPFSDLQHSYRDSLSRVRYRFRKG